MELIKIINKVINKEEYKIIVTKELYKLAVFHHLEVFLYPVIDKENSDPDIVKLVKQDFYKAVKRDETQLLELKDICDTFETNKIHALPLKGSIIKHLYPETCYRYMSDIDMLIAKDDLTKANKLIKQLGYVKKINGAVHIEYEKEPIMVFELHKTLIYKKELGNELFDDIFNRSTLKDNYQYIYKMNDEDFYIFMIVHLLKHYLYGGTGFRSLLDIYVYRINKPNLDDNYIHEQLKKIPYYDLYLFIEKLAMDLFSLASLDEKELEICDYIKKSGTYGLSVNLANQELSENNNSVAKIVLKKFFPSYKQMVLFYPFLEKWKILYPFMYIPRWCHLIFNWNNSSRRYKELKEVKHDKKDKK